MTCILTQRTQDRDGYGKVKVSGRWRGEHRVVYCQANGLELADIASYLVRHTCDNPACVNPEHLVLGSHQDNMDDKVTRDRQCKGEARPEAKLTDALVREIRARYTGAPGQCTALAKEYGVVKQTMSKMLNRQTWKHVT